MAQLGTVWGSVAGAGRGVCLAMFLQVILIATSSSALWEIQTRENGRKHLL